MWLRRQRVSEVDNQNLSHHILESWSTQSWRTCFRLCGRKPRRLRHACLDGQINCCTVHRTAVQYRCNAATNLGSPIDSCFRGAPISRPRTRNNSYRHRSATRRDYCFLSLNLQRRKLGLALARDADVVVCAIPQVPPNSLANRQKAFFDEAFDPFFRVNQVRLG